MKLLDQDSTKRALGELPGWAVEGNSLTRTYHFSNFLKAVAFVNEAARIAEDLGHHPDLDIRYNVVKVSLTTHDCGGITDLDVQSARLLSASPCIKALELRSSVPASEDRKYGLA